MLSEDLDLCSTQEDLDKEVLNLTRVTFNAFKKDLNSNIDKNSFIFKLKEKNEFFQLFNFYQYNNKESNNLKMNMYFNDLIKKLLVLEY